jgi:predicted nuclease of restriction endonuclease-like (RecB) superfamily
LGFAALSPTYEPALCHSARSRGIHHLRAAQYAALRAVNKELVGLYWDIGRLIVERQQREGWGKAVVQQLAVDLRAAFPGVSGFSVQNLWYMRQLFQEYSAVPKLQPLVGEIGWAHNLLILSRCKDALEREFYLRMTRKFGWSKNVLAHHIENQSYEKSLLGQTNFDQTLTPALHAQASLAALDTQVRQEDENPSIGIILCKEKTRTIVEYALRDARKPIGVATYEITKTLPRKLKDQLPAPGVIARLLDGW